MVAPGLDEYAALSVIAFYLTYKLYSFVTALGLFITVAALAVMGRKSDIDMLSCLRKDLLEKTGSSCPSPNILTGNAFEYEKGLHVLDERFIAAYGKTYGW
ncbi:unnamed protein product [Cylicocyclus nassatus]|uniref:Uncharacterized protein n=1 Tax=Cylicocyclus nassatus TaxID=53992 RepID=A0AA36M0K7_CYLNA|nr:unnamed protein product [Cylicocyclus nassatus]